MPQPKDHNPDVEAHSQGFSDGVERRLTAIEVSHADTVRRIEAIEQTQPQVTVSHLAELAEDVKSLKRAFYTFGFSIIAASIAFAFAVFELLGR